MGDCDPPVELQRTHDIVNVKIKALEMFDLVFTDIVARNVDPAYATVEFDRGQLTAAVTRTSDGAVMSLQLAALPVDVHVTWFDRTEQWVALTDLAAWLTATAPLPAAPVAS